MSVSVSRRRHHCSRTVPFWWTLGRGFRLSPMSSRLYKRRLEDVQRQLNQARESLNVLQEQVLVWNDALEDSRIRALVSETPLQAHEYDELSRHVAVANAEMNRRAEEVRELVEARDELLRDWTPEDERG